MRVTRIEGCLLVLRPILATALDIDMGRPHRDSLFMVAELIQNRGMFDKDGLEGWDVARDLVSQDLKARLAKKVF